MSSPPKKAGEVTVLLHAAREGDGIAFDRLMPLIYGELKRIAGRQIRQERPGHTLQPTGLVNEAYLKLVDQEAVNWQDRNHFLAIASRAMRQVLVDHARRRDALKRGGDWHRTTLTHRRIGMEIPTEELLAVDEALDRLDALNPRLRQIVELRFFGGMTEEEVARYLDLSSRTVRRDWVKARAWLHKELGESPRSDPKRT